MKLQKIYIVIGNENKILNLRCIHETINNKAKQQPI